MWPPWPSECLQKATPFELLEGGLCCRIKLAESLLAMNNFLKNKSLCSMFLQSTFPEHETSGFIVHITVQVFSNVRSPQESTACHI